MKIILIIELHKGFNNTYVGRLFNKHYDNMGEIIIASNKNEIKENIYNAVNDYHLWVPSVYKKFTLHMVNENLWYVIQ